MKENIQNQITEGIEKAVGMVINERENIMQIIQHQQRI